VGASERDSETEKGASALDRAHPEAERWRATIERASARPVPEGLRSVEVISHGTMVVKYYAPRMRDEQTPHTRDELYVVARGSGTFVNGDSRHPFTVGDVLFVAAGVPHCFEDFTDDFGTWVIFYGPEGGERPR
jgi:mannose-6-phosphate isomerase-like protein (cupin superfamily)